MPDTAKAAFVEPLKLTDQEHAKLMAAVPRPDDRRAHLRFPAPPGFKVLVRFDTGSAATLAVRLAVLELSVDGISLFHSSCISPGARCVVSMLSIGRDAVALRGRVVHCQFVAGRAHVVGVRFDSPVDPADFLVITPEKGQAPALDSAPTATPTTPTHDDAPTSHAPARASCPRLGS